MKYNLKTLKGTDVKGKKILLRVAYDITLEKQGSEWVVPDDLRIKATLPTINYLLEQGCAVGLLSWLKRPGGKIVPDLSLQPVARRLSKLLGRPVEMLKDCAGPEVLDRVRNLKPGEIVMLENVRFHPEEEKADPKFAKALTDGFELIVYEAFAQSHRVHSSTTGILENLPSVAGKLFIREIETLSKLLENPDSPFIAVLGGAKISDRVDVIDNLLKKADRILIGGALANTFFAAQGVPVGRSLVEDVYVNAAKGEKKDYLALARILLEKGRGVLELPVDLAAAPDAESADIQVVNLAKGESIPQGYSFYDIGPATLAKYEEIVSKAKTVFLNGPMGFFEKEQFAAGTKKLAEVIIASGATSIIGGGDTESIVGRYGWEGKFMHVSTGGGAALEFLAGREFPVMKYLIKRNA